MSFKFRSSAFAFVCLVLSLTVLGTPAWSLSISQSVPYYGRDFYAQVARGDRDDELVSGIRRVLTSQHVQHSGGLDDVTAQCPSGARCYSHVPVGYKTARQKLLGEMYLVEMGKDGYGVQDVYCEKVFTNSDFNKGPVPGPEQIPQDSVINAEHTWPQSKFNGRTNPGTQKCDLHHLFPTDSEMNRIRGNFRFGEVDLQKSPLRCPIVKVGRITGANGDFFEPPNKHKGNVARALFYFSVRYSLHIDQTEEAFLKKWNREDPVDAFERARNDRIQQIQGNRNPFVDFPELADAIANF